MCQLPCHRPLSGLICQLVVLGLCQLVLVTRASLLDFKTSPDHVVGGLTKSVAVNCSLSHSAVSGSVIGKRDVTQSVDNMAALLSLVVSKNGQDVAMVSSVSAARVIDGSSNVQASGRVSGDSGFLQLTITNPTIRQTGEFLCEASGLSATDHTVTLTSGVEIVNSEASIADLVAFVTILSKENGDLKTTVSQMNSKINILEGNEANMQQQIKTLEYENNKLNNKTELMVYFNARIRGKPHYTRGQVVVFDQIEESKGNDYNSGNGLFTCTIPGYYHFTLGCLSESDRSIDLALYHNSRDVFRVYGVAGHDYQGSGNAATLQLASGDVVKVTSYWADSTIDGSYCSFHGYLIQAL